MAFERIRMPKSGIEAFDQGLSSAQSVFDSLSQNKARAAETQRAQTLLPHLIRHYEDAHLLSPYQRRHLEAQIAEQYSLAESHRQENAIDRMLLGLGTKPAPTNSGPSTNPVQTTPSDHIPQNPAGMSRHELVTRANQDQQKYDQNHNIPNPASNTGMFNDMTGQNETSNAPPSMTPWTPASMIAPNAPQQSMQQPAQQGAQPNVPQLAPQEAPQQNASAPKTEKNQFGQEEVITPAAPGKEFIDQFAQIGGKSKRFNPEIVRDKTADAEGYKYTYWPSGKVTRTKVAPSIEEKEELKRSNKEKSAEDKLNRVESVKLESADHDIVKSLDMLLKLNDLLDEGLNTGPAYAIPGVKMFANSDAVTSFDNTTGALQGIIAKNTTGARTGVGALKWASLVKPNISNGTNSNRGSIRSNTEMLISAYNEDKKNWESKNPGKEYPVKLPDVSRILQNKGVKSGQKSGQKATKSLDYWVEDAIRRGADPQVVNAELAKLKAQQSGVQ